MFVRLGKIFVVFALVTTLGAHWVLLQTVAWTTMLTDNLHSNSFHDAVTKTFDGKHPCPICKVIAAGKKSEQKSQVILQLQKLQFPPAKENPILIAPSKPEIFPPADSFSKFRSQKPLFQPPREFFV